MSELSHGKAELETRVEDDQFELDELLEKQRTHISQTASLQSQLTESSFQVEELVEEKASLETTVGDLTADGDCGVDFLLFFLTRWHRYRVRSLSLRMEWTSTSLKPASTRCGG